MRSTRTRKQRRRIELEKEWAHQWPISLKQRLDSLKELGFTTYRDYLSSDLWKKIRRRALNAADNACRLCRRKAWQVHHTQYDLATMKGENLVTLVALCGECHERIEFTGRKTSLPEANHLLKKYLKRERWDRKQMGYDHWK